MAFAPFPLQQFAQYQQQQLDSMSQLVEQFIGRKEQANLLAQRSGDLERIVNREIERCEKKLALQLEKSAGRGKRRAFQNLGRIADRQSLSDSAGRKRRSGQLLRPGPATAHHPHAGQSDAQ